LPLDDAQEDIDVSDVVWWLAAALVLIVAGLVAWMWARRRKPPQAEPAAAPVPEAIVPAAATPRAAVAPVAPAVPVPPTPTVAAPAPKSAIKPPAKPAAPPARPAAVGEARSAPRKPPAPATPAAAPRPASAGPVVEAPAARPVLPRVARFELRDATPQPLLVVERASPETWAAAAELASTPVQRELLGGMLAQAPQLEGAAADAQGGLYAVQLRERSALALARGDSTVAPGPAGPVSVPAQAIDAAQVASFAAAALALQAARGVLPGLHAQVAQAKAAVAALHPKLVAQSEGRLKSLAQDLARYLREVEENYAGAIRKPVFIERVGIACGQAAALCDGAQAPAAAVRAQVEQQIAASRFGEVQLEKSLAALRELYGQRRIQDAAARILSGWEQLRLLLGQDAPAAAAAIGSAAQALAAGAQADQRLVEALEACLATAKVPEYVGKAEFIAHRGAAHELIAAIRADPLAGALGSLAMATAALAAGFAGHAAHRLLLRLDGAGRVLELRGAFAPAISPAAG
jgi:hypothetical protein